MIAETECQKRQGLRKVHYLARDTFVIFPNVGKGIFFNTVDCYIPLDIVALDKNNVILNILTVSPGNNYIGPTPPKTDKVIESIAGYFKSNNWNVGDKLLFLN